MTYRAIKGKVSEGAKEIRKKAVEPFVDLVLGRTISKKLMVFFIATWFLVSQYLTPDEWLEIAKIYVGAQAVIDTASACFGGYNNRKKKDQNKEVIG